MASVLVIALVAAQSSYGELFKFPEIKQGQKATITITRGAVPIREISFTAAADLYKPQFTIKKTFKYSYIPDPDGEVFEYVTILPESISNEKNYVMMLLGDQHFEDIDITFRLPRDKVKDLGSIKLARYEYGYWNIVETQYLRQDSSYHYFKSKLPGMSLLALISTSQQPSAPLLREPVLDVPAQPSVSSEPAPVSVESSQPRQPSSTECIDRDNDGYCSYEDCDDFDPDYNVQCPSCYDGIRNQGEEDIDCGGPCSPCPEVASSAFFKFGLVAITTLLTITLLSYMLYNLWAARQSKIALHIPDTFPEVEKPLLQRAEQLSMLETEKHFLDYSLKGAESKISLVKSSLLQDDIDAAKLHYLDLMKIYNALSPEEQRSLYGRTLKLYTLRKHLEHPIPQDDFAKLRQEIEEI